MATSRLRPDKGILELERRIGVRSGFIRRLPREDDWSFIIKLHALFEAVCTHLLLHHFKEPDLADTFSRLELSNKTTGKIAFLGKLELLNVENRRFITTLSELRSRPCKTRLQREPTERPTCGDDNGRPRLARTAILIKLSTSHKSISASIALFSPYSASFVRAKKAAFAALAACATMARISQRML